MRVGMCRMEMYTFFCVKEKDGRGGGGEFRGIGDVKKRKKFVLKKKVLGP